MSTGAAKDCTFGEIAAKHGVTHTGNALFRREPDARAADEDLKKLRHSSECNERD